MRTIQNFLRLAALLVLLFCLADPICGQDAELVDNGAANSVVEQKTPVAVRTSEITSRASAETRSLKRIAALSESADSDFELSKTLAGEEQTIELMLGDLDAIDATRVSTRSLGDQRHRWQEHQDQQANWLIGVDARWKMLQGAHNDLNQIRQRWELTRDAESWQELPEELRTRVLGIIAQVGPLQEKIQDRAEQMASVLGRLTDVQDRTADALKRLDEISDRVNQRLLRQDASPVWQLSEANPRELVDSVRGAARRWGEELTQFAKTHPSVLLTHLLILLVLLGVTLVASQTSRSWLREKEQFERVRFVASRPYAIAFVLSLLAVPTMYGSAPASVRDVFGFLLIVPMLRLGSGLMNKPERVALHTVLVLFAVHLLVHVCPGGSHLQRMVLLATTALSSILMARVIWIWRNQPRDETGFWNLAGFAGTCLGFSLFAAALIANIAGWLSMAGLLAEATITSGLSACAAVLIVRAGTCLAPLAAQGVTGRLFPSLRRHQDRFQRLVHFVLIVSVCFYWARATLDRLRLLEPLADQWGILMSTPLSWTGLSIDVGQILRAACILVISIFALRAVSFILHEEVFPKLRLRPGATAMLTLLANYVVVGIGLVMTAAVLGLTATQVTVLFGALGVGIGFGLQNIVNNLVCGLILVFEQPLQVGDRVESSGNLGFVKQIGARATVVRTLDGAEVIVPNSDLISKEVINWTRSDQVVRVSVTVGVAYGSDTGQVIAILHQVADENSRVLKHPEPLPLMVGFGESSLDFRLLCWTRDEYRLELVSQLHLAIDAALREAEIVIPFPQRDLHFDAGNLPLEASTNFSDGESNRTRGDRPHETARKVRR